MGAAFTIYKRIITIILNSKINVTEIEAQKMGLFITFLLGEYQQKLFFKNALNPGKDDCSRFSVTAQVVNTLHSLLSRCP